jgi:CheY-like chemotaxis protein
MPCRYRRHMVTIPSCWSKTSRWYASWRGAGCVTMAITFWKPPMALQLSATYAGTIDVLLTDVVMPGGLSGCQVAEQMMAQRPAIKVLYISGYTDAAMTQQLVDHGQAIVLKPFTPDDLARAVSKHLQQ